MMYPGLDNAKSSSSFFYVRMALGVRSLMELSVEFSLPDGHAQIPTPD